MTVKPLNACPLGHVTQIVRVHRHAAYPDTALHLLQLGFLPGENICVLRHAKPGNDPLIVRLGHSNFAMRQFEAACILVEA